MQKYSLLRIETGLKDYRTKGIRVILYETSGDCSGFNQEPKG
jgi:hypothetical protein